MNKTVIKSVSLAVLAGLCWGSMAVVAQHLMMSSEVNGEQLAVLRILGAGVLLVLFDLVSSRAQSLNDVFRKENFKDLLIYGLGQLGIQGAFFLSIDYANAATAAILVLTGPLIVVGFLAIGEHTEKFELQKSLPS